MLLPGVGLRYEFTSAAGERIGIVALRDGAFLIAVFHPDDPDEPRAQYRLEEDEADTVAQLLGAPRVAERFADLTREVPGLGAGQIPLEPGSPYIGRPLGATRARTRTGASIVAIVREDEVLAAPAPDAMLAEGDTLVVVGTHEGIKRVATIVAPD